MRKLSSKMSPKQEPIASFSRVIRAALDHLTDVEWLSTHSPLATPYFLGNYLGGARDLALPSTRGIALRKLLTDAINALHEDGDTYHHTLLHRRFINGDSERHVAESLHISRATHYRHEQRAIRDLEERIIRHIQPSIRLETPSVTQRVIGRDALITDCINALQRGKSVCLRGPSGIGKTTVAASAAVQLHTRPCFWHTCQPYPNDTYEGMLFSLANYLRQIGGSALLSQLLADPRRLPIEMAQALIRNDLNAARDPNDPCSSHVFCFDDIDALSPDRFEDHARIRALIDGMRGDAALLFTSEICPEALSLSVDIDIAIQALAAEEATEWIESTCARLNTIQKAQLQNVTRGNPLLLSLALGVPGNTPVDISIDDGDVLPRLFARVWRKLDSDERNLLTVLSTLRISAPLDAFDEQIIKSLTTRNLVEVDQRGGCKLKWQLRTVIDTYITPDKYKAANMIASSIFAARGQYTEAAKHLISADANEKAVECWYAMRHSEIAQGNAKRALVMFDAVNIDHLTDKHAEVLRLLISELRALQGDPVGAINLLNTRNDNRIGITRVLNLRMVGELDHRIGDDAAAERAYSDALSALEVPSLLDATARCGLAWTQRAQGNREKAWREARFAQCEIELTLGFLRFDQVRYQEAQAHFDIALAIAHDCGYSLGEAKSLDYAAQLSAAQGKHNDAFARWDQATKYYLHCGNLYRLACVRSNQAASLIDLGEYERSVMLASEALHELRLIGAKRAEIGTWQVLAEAQLACNNLDQAEQAARHVIESNQVEYIKHAMLTLAKVMLERQHVSDAEALCRQIADDNESMHHPRLHAHALALLERIRTHGTKMRAAN